MKGPVDQQGIILVVTMVMLLLLTIVGLSSMSMAVLQERMAGNSLDRNYALQAAEATLREAERKVALELGPLDFSALGTATACHPGGKCVTNDLLTEQPWQDVDWSMNSGEFFKYQFDGLPVNFTAAYVIEHTPEPDCKRQKRVVVWDEPAAFDVYRITANTVGRSATARVRLQSVYKKRAGTC